MTILKTHGVAFRSAGRWKLHVTATDGARHISAPTKRALRRRLRDRGVSEIEIERLVPRDEGHLGG